MPLFKRFTIVGVVAILTCAGLIGFSTRAGTVRAEPAPTALPTPCAYTSSLPALPVPLGGAPSASAGTTAQPVSKSSPALSQFTPIHSSDNPIDPYIVNFYSSWKPLRAGGGCSEIWGVVPDPSTLPNWLTTPSQPELLGSRISYYLLAGMLIRNGSVNAQSCENGGLRADNQWVANQCGMSLAQASVMEWQNRFNTVILQVANDTGVPAQLMKNMFSRESQFWPGIYATREEAGLGQLTNYGADTLLMWNTDFYKQFCPQILIKETCDKGYVKLNQRERDLLTGGLVRMVNASCPSCPGGIDPALAEFSVRVFAEGLIANCQQVGQVIQNVTRRPAGRVAEYSDLWLMTLVNYHAGAGCLNEAVVSAAEKKFTLTWDLVSTSLPGYCTEAAQYAQDVTIVPEIAPIPQPPK